MLGVCTTGMDRHDDAKHVLLAESASTQPGYDGGVNPAAETDDCSRHTRALNVIGYPSRDVVRQPHGCNPFAGSLRSAITVASGGSTSSASATVLGSV